MHWPSRRGGGGAKPVESTPAASSASKEPKDKKEDKDPSEGQFDPESLERGAAAVREIDKSKHAAWAYEIGMLQETTEQMQVTKGIEARVTARAQMEERMTSVLAEEARRDISHRAEQERETARFKAEVDAQAQGAKLQLQQETLEYRLKREDEQFGSHEQVRVQNEMQMEDVARETIRMKGEHDRQTALDETKTMYAGMAQQERENIEVRLRELRAKAAEDRSTKLQAIEATLTGLADGARAMHEDPTKMVNLIAGLTTLCLGVYTARAATRVASTVLEKHLGRPPLVRETSRWTWRPQVVRWPWSSQDRPNLFENIVLAEELSVRLDWTTNALLNAQQNGTPFRHVLLHGPPGTGKTLFARTLARNSGLDYAIMSGGDVGPLGHEGPNELHKLFQWAQGSRKGLVLFIDEADAFLREGRSSEGKMSEDARNALSVFLHHTGTESARVAVILATNVPAVLDKAVIDRLDEAFEFPKPEYGERVTMLNMFVHQYLHRPTKRGKMIEMDPELDQAYFAEVAKRTEGMSGRQLAKLILAFQSAVFGSGTTRLTTGLANAVLDWRINHPNA